jgi:hypothetical protein
MCCSIIRLGCEQVKSFIEQTLVEEEFPLHYFGRFRDTEDLSQNLFTLLSDKLTRFLIAWQLNPRLKFVSKAGAYHTETPFSLIPSILS